MGDYFLDMGQPQLQGMGKNLPRVRKRSVYSYTKDREGRDAFCERLHRGLATEGAVDLTILLPQHDADLEWATELLLKSSAVASMSSINIPLSRIGSASKVILDNMTALLRKAPSLKHVSLQRNNDINVLSQLLDAIADNRAVEKLTLGFIQEAITTTKEFDSLCRAPHLTTVECLECHDNVSSSLLNVLACTGSIRNLRLQKHWQPLQERTIRELTSLVASSTTLERLQVIADVRGPYLDYLVASLALNNGLKHLEIHVDKMMQPPPRPHQPIAKAIESIRLPLMIEKASKLTHAVFRGHTWATGDLMKLSQAIAVRHGSSDPSLRSLSVEASDCDASDALPSAFWHAALRLASVRVEWLDFGLIKVEELLPNAVPVALESLVVSCCRFTSEQASTLFTAVATGRAPSLRELKVDVADSITEEVLGAMGQCCVDLQVNFLNPSDLEECKVSVTMSASKSTGLIVLGDVHIEDLQRIAKWIGESASTLNLHWDIKMESLPREGFLFTAQHIVPLVPNLVSLELVWTKGYTEEDGTAFVSAVLQIETLLSICVSESAPKAVQEACRYTLERNRVLGLLQDKNIPKAVWTHVLLRFNRNVKCDVSVLHASVRALANRIPG